ncbi:MAG: hypothetical protein Q8Q56_03640, partial [Alphaproteobacteria bacterium]|nr:hypothetical protein [Alphaproteobacteria bacterium]
KTAFASIKLDPTGSDTDYKKQPGNVRLHPLPPFISRELLDSFHLEYALIRGVSVLDRSDLFD